MPSDRPGEGEIDQTPGLAGGPGPTPPGVDDGLPEPRLAAPEPGGASPPSADAQRKKGEAAERSAGVRRADVPEVEPEREGQGERREAPDDSAPERRTRRKR
jgi:hypothetical protein